MAEKIMVIVAHPDDAEFGCAGSIVRKVKEEGAYVLYVICTNGGKGTPDPSISSEHLTQVRRGEQWCAAGVLGVQEVIFLDYPDGGLEDTPEFREHLVRLIREHRPDTVYTMDPYRRYQMHRDHRIVGRVALDAVFPYARDPLHHASLLQNDGLEPHKVKDVYLFSTDAADHFVDITGVFEIKVKALACHESQMKSIEEWRGFITMWGKEAGAKAGVPLAEGFKYLPMRP